MKIPKFHPEMVPNIRFVLELNNHTTMKQLKIPRKNYMEKKAEVNAHHTSAKSSICNTLSTVTTYMSSSLTSSPNLLFHIEWSRWKRNGISKCKLMSQIAEGQFLRVEQENGKSDTIIKILLITEVKCSALVSSIYNTMKQLKIL